MNDDDDDEQRPAKPKGRSWRTVLVVAGIFVALVVGFAAWLWWEVTEFYYPRPPAMPAVVEGETTALLKRLELTLKAKAPALEASFQPGLSDAAIDALEDEGGFKLTEEMRALYRWRNGTPVTSTSASSIDGLVPIHRFLPLDEAVQQRARAIKDTRGLVAVVSGHRKHWLPVLADGAGDGYYYDPDRADQPGHFFYNFAEDASYEFFPSLNNFLAGVIECYETETYRPAKGNQLDADFERAQIVWLRYAARNER